MNNTYSIDNRWLTLCGAAAGRHRDSDQRDERREKQPGARPRGEYDDIEADEAEQAHHGQMRIEPPLAEDRVSEIIAGAGVACPGVWGGLGRHGRRAEK